MCDERLKKFKQTQESRHFKEKKSNEEDPFNKRRDPFLRDRDRIIYTRAFRRLKDKTQVYTSKKGAHYRARLTHTIEVAQIARSISTQLELSNDLVEAIAYGHDIGHTPFGHAGERVLNDILIGEDEMDELIIKHRYYGFKHNFYSLKILDRNLTKYKDEKGEIIKGLNLNWQTLEGILKHTKIRKDLNFQNGKSINCWNLKKYINKDREEGNLYFKNKYSVTLEGQVVAIADEIAQIEHDLDDGLRNNKVRLTVDELIRKISDLKLEEKDENIKKLKNSICSLEETKEEGPYKEDNLVKSIIDYFIRDTVNKSLMNRDKIEEVIEKKDEKMIFKGKIIEFSENGNKIYKELKKIVHSRILTSYEVARFDWKARFIIRRLFKAYYSNPRQMPEYILERMFKEVKKTIDESKIRFYFETDEKIEELKEIDYKNDREYFESYIKILKLDSKNLNIKKIVFVCTDTEEVIKFCFKDEIKKLFSDEKLNSYFFKKNSELNTLNQKSKKLLVELNYIYIFSIIEHIAGMTDSFAREEYKALYLRDYE